MTKILCLMPICINPSNKMSNCGKERIDQYVEGFTKFFEYINILNEHNIDIIVFDNSIAKNEKLPQELLIIFPSNVIVLTGNNNKYGKFNKGAGLIETWNYLKNTISQYDYLIHFEPRQLLLNFNFINHFLNKNCNLFTMGNSDIKHFNTGLFTIQCEFLIKYISQINLDLMVFKQISIEYDIYDYFVKNEIPFFLKDNMELIWHDIHSNKKLLM